MHTPGSRSPTETLHRIAPVGVRERIALALVVLAYLATRVFRLTALPMFFDEAIHLLWAERWTGTQGLAKALDDGKLLQVAASGIALRVGHDALARPEGRELGGVHGLPVGARNMA